MISWVEDSVDSVYFSNSFGIDHEFFNVTGDARPKYGGLCTFVHGINPLMSGMKNFAYCVTQGLWNKSTTTNKNNIVNNG